MQTRTGLLIIDLQRDVVAGCFDRDGVLERTAALIARARTAQVPVVFIQHEDEDLPPGSHGGSSTTLSRRGRGETVVAKTYRDAFAGVGYSGEQIVANTNRRMSSLRNPGVSCTIASHDQVELS